MAKQQPMRWPLPEVVHPDSVVCYTIKVPNERHYIGAFLGAMFLLSKPYAWGNDTSHTALEVGKVWGKIFDDLISGECSIPQIQHGAEIEDAMPLRIDCDCNVWVTCCDGTEKQILTADQVRAMIQGQPGTGEPQPPAGGGSRQYCGILQARGHYLLPLVVNTGDVVTVDSADGAWNDPDDPGGFAIWRLANGDQFFGGFDVGFPHTDSSDPVPTANHMQLLLAFGDTPTYQAVAVGTPFTIPSGIVNGQLWLQANDSNITNDNGELNVCVTVQNNQATAWSSTFDFRLNSYASLFTLAYGNWTPGTGYVGIPGTGQNSTVVIELPISPAIHTTGATLVYGSDGGDSGSQAYISDGHGFMVRDNPIQTGSSISITGTRDQTGVTNIECAMGDGSVGTQVVVQQMTIRGIGSKPAGWP